MTQIFSFPSVSCDSADRLILGSMPGKASLKAGQYYAHPQNAFWWMMEWLFDISAAADYERRCQGLLENNIALWDVLKACVRTSSLDSDIVESSIVPNDFESFLRDHPEIKMIFFNGTKAENVYRRYVQPNLPDEFAAIPTLRLPSTSPAHASMSKPEKLAHWQVVKEGLSSL